ncbi:MAG: hypothetical protein HFF11_07650 [Angelakisella sp.]|jgi:hypothetical protein|nr:hypothetical protein [Angelakisella sp.]
MGEQKYYKPIIKSEKCYRPVLKNGDHLVSSKKTPGRVRGVSRDKNNKNPDIIEWEEVETSTVEWREEIEEQQEQKISVEEAGKMLAGGFALVTLTMLAGKIVSSWWKKYRKPRNDTLKTSQEGIITHNVNQAEVIFQINATQEVDNIFYQCQFNMGTEELRKHIMNMIYHMLGMVNEIRIMRNAIIKDNSETEAMYFERQYIFEQELLSRVANNLNYFLSNERLMLDIDTSRQVFGLLDGGVYMNHTYIPVSLVKIDRVMREQSLLPGSNY